MISRIRNEYLILFLSLIPIIIFFFIEYKITSGRMGFPLDDSWIYSVFAKNIATGNGYSYNPGEPIAGSTGPLWMLILSLSFLISNSPVFWGLFWGIIFYLLTIFVVYKFLLLISENSVLSFWCTVVLFFNYSLLWSTFSGMEQPVAIFFVLCAIYFISKYLHSFNKIEYIIPVLLGLTTGIRPEAYIFIFLIYSFLLYRKYVYNIWQWKFLVIHTIIFIVCSIPFNLLNYLTWVNIFPTTFYAKALFEKNFLSSLLHLDINGIITGVTVIALKFISGFWSGMIRVNIYPIFIPLLLILKSDTKYSRKDFFFLIIAFFIFIPYCIAFVTNYLQSSILPPLPFNKMNAWYLFKKIYGMVFKYKIIDRYYYSIYFIGTIFGFYGLIKLIKFSKKIGWILLAFAVLINCCSLYPRVILFAYAAKNINEMHIDTGKWISENIPADKTIAINDIGAIKYISPNYIYDLMGIVTPEVLKYKKSLKDDSRIIEYLQFKKPDYLLIFDEWFPIIAKNPEIYKRVKEFKIEHNVASASDIMVLYRPIWNNDTLKTFESEK